MRSLKKGFTIAELLVVVAIIGILVAISIPIYTNVIIKAEQARDKANARIALAERIYDMKDEVKVNDTAEVETPAETAKCTDEELASAKKAGTDAYISGKRFKLDGKTIYLGAMQKGDVTLYYRNGGLYLSGDGIPVTITKLGKVTCGN